MKIIIRKFLTLLFLGSFVFAVYSFFNPSYLYKLVIFCFSKDSYIYQMMNYSWDKQGHFIYMGISAFMLNYLLKAKSIHLFGYSLLLANLLLILGTSLEEIRQLYIPNRNFELLDLLAGTAGIILFGFLGAHLYRFLSR